MSDTKPEKTTTTSAKPARRQHVVAHRVAPTRDVENPPIFDEVVVFGQEIDALRHILGQPDWVYVAVEHGQPLTEALKASS